MRALRNPDPATYTERALEFLEPKVQYLAVRVSVYDWDPEDVAQELRLHLWRKLGRYDHRVAGLNAWAGTVLRRRLLDLAKWRPDPLEDPRRLSLDRDPLEEVADEALPDLVMFRVYLVEGPSCAHWHFSAAFVKEFG